MAGECVSYFRKQKNYGSTENVVMICQRIQAKLYILVQQVVNYICAYQRTMSSMSKLAQKLNTEDK